jgi:hypothetical protein
LLKTNNFAYCFLALTIPLIVIGLAGHRLYGFEDQKIANLPSEQQAYYVSYFKEIARNAQNGWNEPTSAGSDASPLVVGDSMAKDLVRSLRAVEVDAQLLGLDLKCFHDRSARPEECDKNLKILTAAKLKGRLIIFASDFYSERGLYNLKAIVKELQKSTNVKVLGSFRFFNASALTYLYARHDYGIPIEVLFARSVQNTSVINSQLKMIFGAENFIDKRDIFCKGLNYCRLYDQASKPLFFDELHMTIEGQKYLGLNLIKAGIISAVAED